MTNYSDRLGKLMEEKSIDRTRLASALGISYQAVRKVFESDGAFGSKNNLRAAEFFGVSPSWLATGEGEKYGYGGLLSDMVSVPQLPAMANEPSPSAMELALLYDEIPATDRIRRARAYSAASAAILDVLQEKQSSGA